MKLTALRMLMIAAVSLGTAAAQSGASPVISGGGLQSVPEASTHPAFEYGALVQGGNGITDNRDGFHFAMAGLHAGRILTDNIGSGLLRGNFEYAVEVFPYWQSFTPKFQRVSCVQPGAVITCSAPYTVGGTFTGASVTPIILRWNFARHGKFTPWFQGAGGVLWTNHKYPAYGDTTVNLTTNGPNGDASVWNFTPQAGVGLHYFTRPNRSVDFSLMGIHISSASLGDRNPGVNASIQASVGYSWWK